MRCLTAEHYKKLMQQNENCGVKLRSKEESKEVIQQRIEQLKVLGQTQTKEFNFLISILNAIRTN